MLGQVKARSLASFWAPTWVGHLLLLFQMPWQGAGSEVEHLRLEPVPYGVLELQAEALITTLQLQPQKALLKFKTCGSQEWVKGHRMGGGGRQQI